MSELEPKNEKYLFFARVYFTYALATMSLSIILNGVSMLTSGGWSFYIRWAAVITALYADGMVLLYLRAKSRQRRASSNSH